MSAPETTELLHRMVQGDRTAEAELMPRVYAQLHRIALAYLRNERPEHTLQPTALVNEAYMRLANGQEVHWKDRAHFLAVAAQVMRRVLVDHARHRSASKRDAGVRVEFDDQIRFTNEECALVSNLDDALQKLAKLYPRQARVVELRFFGGLTEEEIAEVEGVGVRTVKRDWAMARAWLYGQLS